MRTVLDVLQAHRQQGAHPEQWLGPAEQYERGFSFGVIGRDGREFWMVKGRLRKRWVRVA